MGVSASSTLSFPKDGEGGVSTIRANSTALGVTTFATLANGNGTVSDAGGWTLASTAIGDYVAVSTGEWGVVIAKAAPLLTVDYWRCHIVGQDSPSRRTPATGAASGTIVYGPNILSSATEIRIGAVSFPKSTATETVAITDPFGNAIASLTWTLVAGNGQIYFGECEDGGGLPLYQPFGIKCSNTGENVVVNFAVIR
jgi:hypothetical protein